MQITLGGVAHTATSATFELYNDGGAGPADWNLVVVLDGPVAELRMSGLVGIPLGTEPRPVDVHDVDDPAELELDGEAGSLLPPYDPDALERPFEPGRLAVRRVDDGIRMTGTVTMTWISFADADNREVPLDLAVDLVAAPI